MNSTIDAYFFDSYAIIEIIKGNPNYLEFTKSYIITTKLNLFEVYYSLLREFSEQQANEFLENYFDFAIEFDKDIIKEGVKFRLEHKNKDLSMSDCIGYTLARSLGIKFLTGDEKFKDFEQVEYVK